MHQFKFRKRTVTMIATTFYLPVGMLLLLLASLISAKVTVKSAGMCEPDRDYAIKFTQKIRTEGDVQIIEEGAMKNTVEIGHNIMVYANVESLESNGEFRHLVSAKETVCQVLENYVGEFSHEFEKAAGLKPGTCPIPVGDYKVANIPLEFHKFKYKEIPKGELKITANLMDAKTNETMGCMETILLLE